MGYHPRHFLTMAVHAPPPLPLQALDWTRVPWILAAAVSVAVAGTAACQPVRPPAATAPAADEFAVVRSTAEAAYRSGRANLDRGELELALVELDRARLNDPDSRADIQGALDETVRRLQAIPTPTRVPATPRPTPAPLPTDDPSLAITSAASTTGLVPWTDRQRGVMLGFPPDWNVEEGRPTEFGSGVVTFKHPSGAAEFSLAIDTSAPVVSPELYAARLDVAMQQNVGYATEGVQSGTTAGFPSVRRELSILRPDALGRPVSHRGFQVVVLRGTLPFLLAAYAPAADFERYRASFEQILDSFRFL